MKKIITLLLIATAGLLSSCGDVLDIKPVGSNSAENFYSNEQEVLQGLMGVYATLGRNTTNDDLPTTLYLVLSESRSDNWFPEQIPNANRDQAEIRRFQAAPTTGVVATGFNRLYSMISRANEMLLRTPADEYPRMVAEARFLRAYAYFELVRTWGPVPVVTTPIEKSDAFTYTRQPATEVYAQIIDDLNYAKANLDPFYTGSGSGRVGSWAARTLLAYAYVTMAGYPVNDATAYGKAVAELQPVIGSMDSRFAPTYPQIFALAEENKWDLFSVQFQSGNTGLGSSMVGYSTGGGGSQQTMFPQWVYTSYVLQGQDFRVDSLLVRPMIDAGDTRGMEPILVERYWDMKTPPVSPTPQEMAEHYLRKPFLLTKYLVRDNTNATIKAWNDYPLNVPVLRVSDAYLLYAEALIGTGGAGAKDWIDKVRVRAGIDPLTAEPTMADLFDERRREFIGEGKRYFDLVRQGETVFVNTLKAFADHYRLVSMYQGTNPSARDMLLPLPQESILNIHTDWGQNNGY